MHIFINGNTEKSDMRFFLPPFRTHLPGRTRSSEKMSELMSAPFKLWRPWMRP